jgi:hypothetical protein
MAARVRAAVSKMERMQGAFAIIWLFVLTGMTHAQSDPLALVARQAEEFQRLAVRAITVETLHQTSLREPPHARIVVGASALDLGARFLNFDVVSEYAVGHLKGAGSTDLLELREIVSLNGRPVQTPEVARRALSEDIRSGEDRVRKHLLGEFTRLGLVDVATDYGLILLAFTGAGQRELRIQRTGEEFVGTEEAVRFEWSQSTGGAVEFRGRKTAHRTMQGSLWVRKGDGLPLRISARFEHPEPKHFLRDEATVEYAASRLGFPEPVTVVHRHYVDGAGLTENLYSYAPFRLFGSETTIRYGETAQSPVKK